MIGFGALKGLGFREDVHSFIGFVNFTGSKGLTGFSGAYRIYGWGFRAHGSRYVTVFQGLSLWSFGPRFSYGKMCRAAAWAFPLGFRLYESLPVRVGAGCNLPYVL